MKPRHIIVIILVFVSVISIIAYQVLKSSANSGSNPRSSNYNITNNSSNSSNSNDSNTLNNNDSTTTTPTLNSKGQLQPNPPGGGECSAAGGLPDKSSYGQLTHYGSATCTEADSVVQSASGHNGGAFKSGGYSCTSTPQQASNGTWGSYWQASFNTYTCSNGGSGQIAFNWQSAAAATESTAQTQ